jgi:hypothetical protein
MHLYTYLPIFGYLYLLNIIEGVTLRGSPCLFRDGGLKLVLL